MPSHDLSVNWTNPDDFAAENQQFDPWTLELEQQILFGEANLDQLANKYSSYFHRDGIVRMLQDIDKQASVYANMFEEFKKPPRDQNQNIVPRGEGYFLMIVQHYEAIGAIPKKSLPPETSVGAGLVDWTQRTVKRIIEKLEKLTRAALQAVARYGEELAAWLRPRANAVLAIQASISWKPSVTVQLEFGTSFAR